jgi:hypothetical protein
MANGLDRLERFFSSRRKLSEPCDASNAAALDSDQTFPAPSFLRPKANRMAAREEVSGKHNSTRTSSTSGPSAMQRMDSVATRQSTSTGSFTSCGAPSVRSPSLAPRYHDSLIAGLNSYQFPKPPGLSSEPPGLIDSCSSKSLRPKPPALLILPHRVDTPPSSEPEEDFDPRKIRGTEPQNAAPPTPGSSPCLSPKSGPRLRDSKLFDSIYGDLEERGVERLSGAYEGSTESNRNSHSSHKPSRHDSVCSSTLREPDFSEFLSLSDDDIAESAPENNNDEAPQSLPLMALSISSTPQVSSLLTLTPPRRASRPATAAAFEAARIANRYDFDLIYVVNLWPDKSPASRSSTSSDILAVDQADNGQRPLVGRLLAAHGLHHVPSPLQISSTVHSAVLRADGWVEYRNSAAEYHDLARGYACAFYTGQYAKGGSIDANAPVSGVRLSEQINRGIVFAAYRKPRAGDCKLGTDLKEEELGKLHADAEALVEMLIDIHVANRQRQPLTPTQLADELGPMPSTQLNITDI